jgi:hypothetical protein
MSSEYLDIVQHENYRQNSDVHIDLCAVRNVVNASFNCAILATDVSKRRERSIRRCDVR